MLPQPQPMTLVPFTQYIRYADLPEDHKQGVYGFSKHNRQHLYVVHGREVSHEYIAIFLQPIALDKWNRHFRYFDDFEKFNAFIRETLQTYPEKTPKWLGVLMQEDN